MSRNPWAPTEKPKDFGNVWKRIFDYMGRYRYALCACVGLSIGGSMLSLIGPRKISEMTDLIESAVKSGGPVDLEGVAAIGFFLVALYAVSAVMSYAQGQIMATIAQRISGKIREDVSAKITRVPLGFFDKASTGDLMSRVTNDADRMGQGMNQSLSQLITACVMFSGTLTMMLITNVVLAATAVGCTALGFLIMWIIVKKSQVYFSRQQANLGRMNGHISETYSSQNIVMAYGGGKEAMERFDEINESLASTAVKSQFLSGTMMPLMGFIGNLGYVAVCLVGAILVIDGGATIGTVVAFLIYIRLFTQPMSQISQAFNGMQSVAAGAERVFSFLDEPELADESSKTARIGRARGHVEFRDVHFGYEPGREIIKGFSAEVCPGQKVAIVGPTGAGKTTIVNLLMRFYEIGKGDILIDGVSVKDMTRANVHEQFCMVLQDAWLFEGTIRENIVYGRENVSDERIEEACKAVGIDRHIAALPNGYDTVLGEAAEMSAGQRQQLVIARAMVSDAPMLILDEATSSVDTRTEASIQKSMDDLSRGRTSFVIAHRLSTIRNADLILVMKDGNVIEKGTHDQLMGRNGFYRDLYDSQFEKARGSSPEPVPDPRGHAGEMGGQRDGGAGAEAAYRPLPPPPQVGHGLRDHVLGRDGVAEHRVRGVMAALDPVYERGLHPSRRDLQHGDPPACNLVPQGIQIAPHESLGRRVDAQAVRGDVGGLGAEGDDRRSGTHEEDAGGRGLHHRRDVDLDHGAGQADVHGEAVPEAS